MVQKEVREEIVEGIVEEVKVKEPEADKDIRMLTSELNAWTAAVVKLTEQLEEAKINEHRIKGAIAFIIGKSKK